jgi:hypothetical protein
LRRGRADVEDVVLWAVPPTGTKGPGDAAVFLLGAGTAEPSEHGEDLLVLDHAHADLVDHDAVGEEELLDDDLDLAAVDAPAR